MKLQLLLGLGLAFASFLAPAQESSPLRLHDRGYLTRPGLDVLVFSDIYPDGHQTGVTIIQHGATGRFGSAWISINRCRRSGRAESASIWNCFLPTCSASPG